MIISQMKLRKNLNNLSNNLVLLKMLIVKVQILFIKAKITEIFSKTINKVLGKAFQAQANFLTICKALLAI